MDESRTFDGYCKQIAEDFLQTVVVLDDEAVFFEQTDEGIPSSGIIEPGSELVTDETPVPDPMQAVEKKNKLDAKKLIDAFAEKGIVCAVLRPNAADDLSAGPLKASLRSDIVILDWQLSDDDGEKALYLIDKLIENDSIPAQRKRTICIYTFSQNFVSILSKIYDCLMGHGIVKVTRIDDPPQIVSDNLRISVVSKRQTSVANLPDLLVSNFASVSGGLLSNVVLSSLAALKRNAHRLLAKISKDMDYPYLSHRVFINHPGEAEDYAVSLISEEIDSILKENEVGKIAGSDIIRLWLQENGDEYPLDAVSKTGAFILPEIENLLVNGFRDNEVKEMIKRKGIGKKVLQKKFSSILFKSDSGQLLNKKFAVLSSCRSFYENKSPSLTLGTIIGRNDGPDAKYFLCIQPRCDCVRIDGHREFLFLPLIPTEDPEKPIVIPSSPLSSEWLMMDIVIKSYKIHIISFSSKERRCVIADKKRPTDSNSIPSFVFIDSKETEWFWVAELKWANAQRIAHQYTSEVSRIGIDEFEWIRKD